MMNLGTRGCRDRPPPLTAHHLTRYLSTGTHGHLLRGEDLGLRDLLKTFVLSGGRSFLGTGDFSTKAGSGSMAEHHLTGDSRGSPHLRPTIRRLPYRPPLVDVDEELGGVHSFSYDDTIYLLSDPVASRTPGGVSRSDGSLWFDR